MRHAERAWLLVLAGVIGAPRAAVPQSPPPEPPRIAVWSTEHDAFRRGDRVGVWFRTDMDGFVAVMRVDTDGRVRVLFPRDPGDANRVVGHNTYAVPNPYEPRDAYAFLVDDYPGVGYLFAVVSLAPFDFGRYERNAHWDYRAVAQDGRITGDPYVALADLAGEMLPADGAAYGYDIVPYFVEQRYEYPRFVCYDCHRYVAYSMWDPYRDWCGTFRLVVYDPPRLYPTRIYPATEVIVAQPAPAPRFVFQPRTDDEPLVVRVEGEPAATRPRERGATGRDVGGVGAVPTPEGRRPTAGRGAGGILGAVRRILGGEPAAPAPRTVTPQTGADPQRDPARPTLERRRPTATPTTKRPDDPPANPTTGTVRRPETTTPDPPSSSGSVRRPASSSTPPATRRPDPASSHQTSPRRPSH